MTSHFDHARELVYAQDRTRFLASLFAPEKSRRGLMALYAFNIEIARVRELVREPLPGEVRLQWWRDFLNGVEHGDAAANPFAAALAETIKTHALPVKPLTDMIDARIFDLYNDPMPSLNDLEGYCGETVSMLIQLAMTILNGEQVPNMADVAGHAGVAYGLCGLLRALPWHVARRQCYLPKDLLERHGLTPQDLQAPVSQEALKAAHAELRDHIRHHLGRVSALMGDVPAALLPALLPLALVRSYLAQMEKPAFDPLKDVAEISQLRSQWILWRASRNPARIAR